jgi:hypothetical protein
MTMKMNNTVMDTMNDDGVGTIQLSYNINGKTVTPHEGFSVRLHGATVTSMGDDRPC